MDIFNWVNQFHTISSLSDLNDIQTLALFIEKLFKISINKDSSQLNEILNQITFNASITLPENFNFQDENHLLALLEFIQSQYQYYTLHHHLLTNSQLSYTSYVRRFIQLSDLNDTLIAWLNYILSDYISASFILPIHNLLASTNWINGHYLLCMLHYHIPSIVSNLNKYLQEHNALSIFIKLFTETFHIHPSFVSSSLIIGSSNMMQLLVDFIPFLKTPTDQDSILRHQHMNRFKSSTESKLKEPPSDSSPLSSTPSLSSTIEDEEDHETFSSNTTLTSTYTHFRLTKTTKYSTHEEDDNNDNDDDDDALADKLNHLLHQLELIIPTTRSSNYSPTPSEPATASTGSGGGGTGTATSFTTDWDNDMLSPPAAALLLLSHHTLPSQFNEEHPSHQQPWVRILHPLQASEEDNAAYERNFRRLFAEFQALPTNNNNAISWRVQKLYETVKMEFEHAEACLAQFQRGFAFARVCTMIRQDLDSIQHQMVKSITTQQEIQDLQDGLDKTRHKLESVVEQRQQQQQEPPYVHQMEFLVDKIALVQSWIDEVRIWFAEAERIRRWIEIRIDRLEAIRVPDAFSVNFITTTTVVSDLGCALGVLEKEIETFDKEDMARLRSHVKMLTSVDRGANKDLSPADTTTIEITLTTLTALDKLMHALRRKTYDFQLFTQRVAWEEEYARSMVWLTDTHVQVDVFLCSHARWTPAEEDDKYLVDDDIRRQRMEREKQKKNVIQQLVSLEKAMAEFDQGQFTTTVELFQDLDSASSVDLHEQLESRQSEMEQLFEDLLKRMAFARKVVEQRLTLMDFLHQADLVIEDGLMLQMDLVENTRNSNNNDREWTARVQNIHDVVAQLVTTIHRIPYPMPELDLDKDDSKKANDAIRQVVTCKQNELVLLSEDVEARLHSLRNNMQLQRRAKEYLDEADTLTDWAYDRVKAIRRAKTTLQDDMHTIKDLPQLQRDYDHIVNKLKNGKENQVIELLTRIQMLLETTQKLRITTVDRETLREVADHLQERFDRLQQILEDYGLLLDGLRQKLKHGQTYAEQARGLREYIHDTTRHTLPHLKQTCGFMTGQSQEQDQNKLDTLTRSLMSIKKKYNNEQQACYKQLCKQSRMLETADDNVQQQRQLDREWDQLQHDIQDMEAFAVIVGQWYERQRRLSTIEHTLLQNDDDDDVLGCSADIEAVAKEKRIQNAIESLDEIAKDITMSFNSQDPLQIANYSCARDRQLALMQKAKAAMDALKKSSTTQAVAVAGFLKSIKDLNTRVGQERETIERRMDGLGGFASTSMTSIDDAFNRAQKANGVSEKAYQTLSQSFARIMAEGCTDTDEEKEDAIAGAKTKLSQLRETIQLEKKQAIFVGKVYVHAKAAHDLQMWIDQCSDAITQLLLTEDDDSDVVSKELDLIELKMMEMKPTMQTFEGMKPRIFATTAPLGDICLDHEQVNQAIQERENFILKRWQSLQMQHKSTRQRSTNHSKQGQEALDKIKYVMVQIGDMKNRVNAVRICRNTQLDDGLENRDLNTILNCPLTSIPTEHRLASAKAELDILERGIETDVYSSAQALSSLLEQEEFHGHKKEMIIAVKGLTELMKAKRQAIAEAEKMEGFLTVMEELEVLLLALTDVISRGSPEHDRSMHSQADLQALYIDLDTRYRYYEPKINALFDEANEVSEKLKDDRRVIECLDHLIAKWKQLQREGGSNKMKLLKLIGPQAEPPVDLLDVGDGGILKEKAKKVVTVKAPVVESRSPPTPKPIPSTPRCKARSTTTTPLPFALSATAARAQVKRSAGGTTSPVERRVNARQAAAQQQRLRVTTKMPAIPETYVADPKNDLDVALGDIVNECPYKIQVKMVPGEVGKYWFGHVNPKLAYCRILRSGMVMVRVGGGWTELSQFLRDHALLEEQITPCKPSRASLPPTPRSVVQDVFLSVGNKGGGGYENKEIIMNTSTSTPVRRSVPSSHGIKSGNKFLVDVDGNQVEVKMTKAKSKTTKFITPRRNL